MPTNRLYLGYLGYASVERIRLTITKDGSAWTGIDSVSLVLQKPEAVATLTRSCTLETPDAGVWYYDTRVAGVDGSLTTDLDTVGLWRASVVVTDGTIVKEYPHQVVFHVSNQP